MAKANYTWEAHPKERRVHITDLYSDAAPTLSVTNDAEVVVAEVVEAVKAMDIDLAAADWVLTYTDTEGQIDRLLVNSDGNFDGFAPGPF